MSDGRTQTGSREGLQVSALHVELTALDRLKVESLVLGVFVEDRPLRGAAGYCDWRLNGRLSAAIQDGGFKCAQEETLLSDTNRRIGPERLLLFGLGKKAKFDTAGYRQALRHMLVVAKRARFSSLGLELPSSGDGPLEPRQAVSVLFEVANKAYPDARITLLCPDKAFVELVLETAKADKRVQVVEPPDVEPS